MVIAPVLVVLPPSPFVTVKFLAPTVAVDATEIVILICVALNRTTDTTVKPRPEIIALTPTLKFVPFTTRTKAG